MMLDVKKNENLQVIEVKAYYEKTRDFTLNKSYKTAVLKVRYSNGDWVTIFRKIINDVKNEINKFVSEFVLVKLEHMKQILNLITKKMRNIFDLYLLEYMKYKIDKSCDDIDLLPLDKQILIRLKKRLRLIKLELGINKIERVRIYTVELENTMCDIIEIKRYECDVFENIFKYEYNNLNYELLENHKILNIAEISELLLLTQKKEQLRVLKRYINKFSIEKDKKYTKLDYLKN